MEVFMKKSKILFEGILILAFEMALTTCEFEGSDSDITYAVPVQITVTGIAKNYQYAKINICPTRDFGGFIAGSGKQPLPISKGTVTGPLYDFVNDTVTAPDEPIWNGRGDYYITLVLFLEKNDTGYLFVYTDGAVFDCDNIPQYNINSNSITIPFNQFKEALPPLCQVIEM
jgi:hypothetical protein